MPHRLGTPAMERPIGISGQGRCFDPGPDRPAPLVGRRAGGGRSGGGIVGGHTMMFVKTHTVSAETNWFQRLFHAIIAAVYLIRQLVIPLVPARTPKASARLYKGRTRQALPLRINGVGSSVQRRPVAADPYVHLKSAFSPPTGFGTGPFYGI